MAKVAKRSFLLRIRADWLAILACILISIAAGSITYISQQLRAFNDQHDDGFWAAAQVQSDLIQFQRDLELYIFKASDVSFEQLSARLEVLELRLDQIMRLRDTEDYHHDKDGEVFSELPDEYERAIEALSTLVSGAKLLTALPGFRDGPEAETMTKLMDGTKQHIHDWARAMIENDSRVYDHILEIEDQRILLALNILLLTASLATVLGIFINNRNTRTLVAAERKARLEAELASESQDRFIASMSHELRTPLNAILGFSELLLSQRSGQLNARQQEYLGDIASSGHMLLSLINDILDFSKLEAKMHEPSFEPVDLCRSVEQACALLKPSFIAGGGRIHYEKPKQQIIITTDERFALQSITNLLSNAARYSPQDGVIDIVIAQDDDWIRLTIRDRGPGLTEDEIERAFQPFQQIQNAYVSNAGGTGLGLTLTRSFCQIIGAELALRPAKGKGLAAEIKFPTSLLSEKDIRNKLDGFGTSAAAE